MPGAERFRWEMDRPDGRPIVVFEEQEDPETGTLALVTTFCDASVSAERWQELERRALAEWIRQDPPTPIR